MKTPKEAINEFDEEHIIKQVILIGVDGKVRNIEFEVEEDEKEQPHLKVKGFSKVIDETGLRGFEFKKKEQPQ